MKPDRAIIPLAGLGSRLYPATKVIPKALLPVPGRDGSLRPAVDWIVREAVSSGVEEILLIVLDRDHNAAKNILAKGFKLLAEYLNSTVGQTESGVKSSKAQGETDLWLKNGDALVRLLAR